VESGNTETGGEHTAPPSEKLSMQNRLSLITGCTHKDIKTVCVDIIANIVNLNSEPYSVCMIDSFLLRNIFLWNKQRFSLCLQTP